MALVAGMTTVSAETVTFDFVNNVYGMTRLSGTTNDYNPDPTVVTSNSVTLTLKNSIAESTNGAGSRLWSDGLRFYKGGTMEITAPANVTTVVATFKNATQAGSFGFEPNTVSTADKVTTWTGDAAKVVLSYTATSSNGALATLSVTYGEPGETPDPNPNPNPNPNPEPNPGDALWSSLSEDSATCDWTFDNVAMPEELSYIWNWKAYNNKYYLNASAYLENVAYVSEAYAISPALTITGGTKVAMSFDHAAKFQTTLKELCCVVVREKGATTWTALTIPTWPEAGAWTFANSGDIDLSAYIGKTIEIAFKYASTASGADTWEVKNVKLTGDATVTAEGGSTPNPNPNPDPEAVVVESIADMLTLTSGTKVKVMCDLTVAFVNNKNIFCVDEAGDAIQVYAENTATVNQIIPAGWEANYKLYNDVTPELTDGTLPEAKDGGKFTPRQISDGAVTVDMVNEVVEVMDVTFDAATPDAKENFEGVSAGKTLSFRNNYTIAGVPAGLYNVTVVVTIYQDEPSLYVTKYSSTSGVTTIDAEGAEAVYYDINGRVVKGNLDKGLYIRVVNGNATKVLVK